MGLNYNPMDILRDAKIVAMFGTRDNGSLMEPWQYAEAVLSAMQADIKKGERYLLWRSDSEWIEDDRATQEGFHPMCLRLPDKFQSRPGECVHQHSDRRSWVCVKCGDLVEEVSPPSEKCDASSDWRTTSIQTPSPSFSAETERLHISSIPMATKCWCGKVHGSYYEMAQKSRGSL